MLSPVSPPDPPDDGCWDVGCRRPGRRTEVHEIVGRLADGAPFTCRVDAQDWPRFTPGARVSVRIGAVFGTMACGRPVDPG